MPKSNNAEPGTAQPEAWEPYKLWVGDLWVCHGCGTEIVSGVAMNPIAEHYQDGFLKSVESLNASQFQVNDC
jgi:hypothetical protein